MKPVRLRPHHLLCTQGYSGKGYSSGFVENMTRITGLLRGEGDTEIKLVFTTDSLCAACPKKLGEGRCEDDKKVLIYDKKVIDYFGLEEKRYLYKEITARINGMMTEEIMADICSGCSWYPVSACRKNILMAN